MDNQKRIIFYGNLGKEPELKYTRKLEPVCNFSVAETIDGSEKPVWHKVIVWGKQAESCKVFLKKGGTVFIQGRVIEKEFTNERGELKKYKEVNADKIGYPMEHQG
jgi:single-strand DNA-binding protein